MFVENINLTTDQLNYASGVVSSISGIVFSLDDLNNSRQSYYRTSIIEVYNGSGNTISFIPMSDNEYNLWNSDRNYSSYISVRDDTLKTMTNMKDGITKIVCKGSSGHTSGIAFTVMKERW